MASTSRDACTNAIKRTEHGSRQQVPERQRVYEGWVRSGSLLGGGNYPASVAGHLLGIERRLGGLADLLQGERLGDPLAAQLLEVVSALALGRQARHQQSREGGESLGALQEHGKDVAGGKRLV